MLLNSNTTHEQLSPMVLSHMFNAFSNLITATSFSSSPFTGSVTTRAAFSGCAFLCGKCSYKKVASIEATKLKQYQRSNSDLCHYNVNHLFSLALQLIGCGGEHGSMIAAFLNLPEPVKWKRQFNVLENFTYDAIQNVKNLSEEEAAQEEVQETVNEEDN